jgi:hypothetical protein
MGSFVRTACAGRYTQVWGSTGYYWHGPHDNNWYFNLYKNRARPNPRLPVKGEYIQVLLETAK